MGTDLCRPADDALESAGADYRRELRGGAEPLWVLPHPEAPVGSLHLRLPEHRRPAGIGRSPSSGSRQVINRYIAGVKKHITRLGQRGGVPFEINAREVGAARE